MKKWAAQVDTQRRIWRDAARVSNQNRQTSTSATEFTYMQNQGSLVNPYAEDDDPDDGDFDEGTSTPNQSYGYMSTNGSNSSLRSRSGTGDSIFPGSSRQPPPRFPMLNDPPPPQLSLQTRQLASVANAAGSGVSMSPTERHLESYFSPTAESPISQRTSSSSTGMFSFSRQPTIPNGWHPDDNARFTAPAMGRTTPVGGRGTQRPSLPPAAHSVHGGMSQSRLRSASSPDIQNPIQRGPQPPVPEIPVPPFPTHYAYAPTLANRSNPNLPGNQMPVPIRSATQSPTIQRERMMAPRSTPAEQPAYYDPRYGAVSRGAQPYDHSRGYPSGGSLEARTQSPPTQVSTPGPQEAAPPTQLKVKVICPSAGSSMTLVVSTNISYQSLKDRIDAKLQRSTNVSLSTGAVKLKYLDDGDYISIQSDEDVREAFESWREQQRDHISAGQMGEIELYCQ